MESFLSFIVYSLGLVFLFYELAWLTNPVTEVEIQRRFKELKEMEKGRKWDDYSSELKSIMKTKGFFMIFALFFLLFGLFTFNWVAFASFLLFQVVFGLVAKLFEFNWVYLVLNWLNSLLGALFVIFVIVNHYHLRIDLWEYVQTLF